MDKNEANKCKYCIHWNEGTLSCNINTGTVYWGAEDYCSKHKVKYTYDYFKKMMAEIATSDNTEIKHYKADQLMIAVLNQLGYDEGAKIFENMEKWYS